MMTIMQFTRSRDPHFKPRSILIALLFAVIILFIIFNETIGGFLLKASSFLDVSRADVYRSLPKSVLASRLLDAEEELARIRYQALLYSFAVEEEESLRASLGLPNSNVYARGDVISRPPRTHYDTFVVSYDTSKMLEVGDMAFFEGILIGSVSELGHGLATVSLLSSPGTSFDVRGGDPSAIVVMHGLGGGSYYFDIPKEVSLHEGDSITTANAEGHVIAIVSSIVDAPELTTKRVYAHSPINTNDVRVIEFTKSSL